jgi:hypothetical protein
MANPIVKYQNFVLRQFNGGAIDFDTDTLKVMLTTSTYVPAPSTDIFKAAVTNEVSGTNYTARGNTITGVTATQSLGTATITGNTVTWLQSATGFTNARYAVVYKDTGVDATSPLIGYIDLVTNQGNTAGDLLLNWNSTATSGTILSAT